MANDTRSNRKTKDDESSNSKGKQTSGKGLSSSALESSDTSTLRRSARETLSSKKNMTSSPSSTRKSERLEKRISTTPPSQGKSEKVEKHMTPVPLRRSERGKKPSSSSSSGSKKSDKSSSSSKIKLKKEKKEKSVKQLTMETKEVCNDSKKKDTVPLHARVYRAMFKRQPKKVKVEDHNKELKMRDKSSQVCNSEHKDESLKKVSSNQKDENLKKVKSKHKDEGLKRVNKDDTNVNLKNVNGDDKYERLKKVISNTESSERRHEELRDKEFPSSLEITGEEPNAGVNRSAQEASRVWEANGLDVGDSITFSKSGDTAIEASDDTEQAQVDCLSKEKSPSPELLDYTMGGPTLDGVIGTERCHELSPLKRKRKEVNVHPESSSVFANKSTSTGEVITLPTECSDRCGTCFKKRRLDHDSAGQECCSCLPKSKEKLDEGSCDASVAKDRGKLGAGVTTDVIAKVGNHMQQNGSFVDIPADGFQNTCLICKLGGKLLCCDGIGCKRIYHLSCLDPPLEYVPLGAWYCIPCVRKKIESGVHSLSKGIESIWDVREEVSDADGLRKQKKYFVKYRGLAHVHNRWVPESQLLCEAPSLVSKFNRRNQVARWKVEWTLPHRLLQKRSLVSLRQYEKNFNEHDGSGLDCHFEWLVKWRGLDYEHSTWELETEPFIKSLEGQSLIRDYENRRNKAKIVSCLSSVEKKTEKGFPIKLDHLLAGGSSVPKNNLDFVNKLREYWHKGHNAVVFDDQERIVKVILFILSLLSDVSRPFLIISTSTLLLSWEDEFSRLAPSTDVVVYNGSKEIRTSVRTLEFYEEGGCIMFQALITSPEIVIEDLNVFESIGWEAIIVDECQRSKISSHFEQIKMLITDMRLLLVSGQLKDTIAEYLNMLSVLDYQPDKGSLINNEGLTTDSVDDISSLKEKLSKYVAYGGKLDSSRFVEFWVPVQISNVQLEQYCATLLSNSLSLCSPLKNDPVGALRDILISMRKCCDHPYVLDPSLRSSLLNGLQVTEFLDVEIKASGKLQLLDTMLSEMKNQALRVLILFQSSCGPGKNTITLGDILDDYVRQRFGPDSYERVDGNVIPSKKQASMNNFNKKSERFVFLLETRACLPSIKLSSVDMVIIFDSDWSPVNDLRALQKITLESQFEQIKVLRLYSSFTVEEKALILAKQGRTPDGYLQNMSRSSSHALLMWGASYLFNRLVEYHGNDSLRSSSSDIFEKSLLKNVTQEFLTMLTKTGEDNDGSKLNVILKVKQTRGTYSTTFPLFGESKIEVIDEGAPHVFWMKLLEGRSPCWKYSFVSSQRSRKRVQYFDDSQNKSEGKSSEVVKKHKKVADNPGDPSSMKPGLGGKKVSRNNEGTSGTPALSKTIALKHASPSSCLVNNISRSQRELYYSQKNLHLLLKAEIAKLCEVLRLREDVKDTVEKFLEYFMINHRVSREPETILQAFQISVCWTAASLQKQKISHKESFAVAKQQLNLECKKEDAELSFLKLQCLKKLFLFQLEKLKVADCSKVSEMSNNDIGSDHLNTSLSQTETPDLQKVKVEVEHWSTAQECSDKQDVYKVAQIDFSKCINKIQKKFQKQMAKLFQKHQKEMEDIHQQYEEEKANLENKKRTETAVIFRLHTHSNSSMKIDRLKILDNEYATQFEDLRSEKDTKLKNLEEMKITAMKMVKGKEASWVEELKSWVEVELSNMPLFNDFEHDVQNMLTSQQIKAHDILENIIPTSSHLSGEKNPNNLVPITLVGGVESPGVHQTVPYEAAVCSHPIESGGPVGACRVIDKIDTIASERASVSGFKEHIHSGNLVDNQEKVVSMNSCSNQQVPDRAMLSMPGRQIRLEVTETVSSSDNPGDGHPAFHSSAEQICDRFPLNPEGELLMGMTKTASSNNAENVVLMNAPSLDEQINEGAIASMTSTEVLLKIPEAGAPLSEEQAPNTAALTIPQAGAPVVVPENVSSSDGTETVVSINLSSSRVKIPNASLSMPDVEVLLGVPESSPDKVVEGSNTNEENDELPAMSLNNATELKQTDGVSCNINVNLHLHDLSHLNSRSVQTPTTTSQDGPVPPNQSICSEVIASTVIQNGDAAPGDMQIPSGQFEPSLSHLVDDVASNPSNHAATAEMQIPSQQFEPSQSLPVDDVASDPSNHAAAAEMLIPSQQFELSQCCPHDNVESGPSNHETPASEPVAQLQVLPSTDVLSGHNPSHLPSASGVGAQPSNDHCIAIQSAQAQNNVELSNQAVLHPSTVFAPTPIVGPTVGLGTNESDTNTASIPSAHSNHTAPNLAPVTSWSPLHLYHDPLQKELERISRENDKTMKIHEETKLRMKSDCEREIEEAVTQIRRKFEIKLKETEAEFQSKKRELDAHYHEVLMNKILAEAFKSKCMDLKASSTGMQQELTSSFIHRLAQLSSQQSTAQRPSVLAGSLSGPLATTLASTTTTPSTLLSTSLPSAASPHAAVPPLQPVHHPSALFSSGATRPPHISSINSPSGNQVGGGIRAPAPHLQPFRPSLPISSTSLPSSSMLPSQQIPINPPATSLSLPQYPSRPPPPPPPPTFHPSTYSTALLPETAPSLHNASLSALELLRDFDSRSGANAIPPSILPPLSDLASSALQSGMRASLGQVSGAADIVCLSDDE